MKKILIISLSPLHRDPRVKRQVKALKKKYSITCAGYTDVEELDVKFWPVKLAIKNRYQRLSAAIALICRQYMKFYWQMKPVMGLCDIWKQRGCQTFDLIIANDILTLPFALEIAAGNPVFIDAHEYSPRQNDSLSWRILWAPFIHWQCRTYLNDAALMSTVNSSLSREFERQYGKKSIVIYNAPAYQEIEPGPVDRKKKIRLVHHGIAARQRGLEEIISLLNYLDDHYTLDFYLIAPNQNCIDYLAELKGYAQEFSGRVKFNEPIPTEQIAKVLNQFDIGVALIQPSNFNNAHSLSNKFFEYIQARLALAAGPTPDMKVLIEKYGLGVVSEEFTAKSLANKISSLTVEDIFHIKQNAHDNAELLSFNESERLLLKSVYELTGE